MIQNRNAPGHKAEGALNHCGGDESAYSTAASAQTIEITHEAFGCGFDVVVKPQIVPDNQGWEFREHAQAMAFAQSLHQQHGWAIVDRTGGDHG